MKLITYELRVINSKDYSYGWSWVQYGEQWVTDAIEESCLDKLPLDINEGWYLYGSHPELVSDN